MADPYNTVQEQVLPTAKPGLQSFDEPPLSFCRYNYNIPGIIGAQESQRSQGSQLLLQTKLGPVIEQSSLRSWPPYNATSPFFGLYHRCLKVPIVHFSSYQSCKTWLDPRLLLDNIATLFPSLLRNSITWHCLLRFSSNRSLAGFIFR